jgi:RNA polymerase subunit RPABC4/transcription elongation factor Spt4
MVFWSIFGIVIGLIIFLLLMNIGANKEGNKTKIKKHYENNNNSSELGTKPRYCPVCGSKLGPRDVIYAEIFHSEPRDKVIIKGCKYCYVLTPEESARIKPYTKKIRDDDIGIGKQL